MSNEDVIKELIQKTMDELSAPEKPTQHSRTWTDPKGYIYLVQWSNTVLLRYLIRLFTNTLPKSEYRRKAQIDDAGRSVVRNIEEGYKRSNTSTYIEFIGFSQGSLEEVGGDMRELVEDGFLKSVLGSSLASHRINLQEFHDALLKHYKGDGKGALKEELKEETKCQPRSFSQPKASVYTPLTDLYPPLNNVRAQDLTYEVFNELINKTDFLLRKLVESLEHKLNTDRKFYQVHQARLKDKIK